MISKSYYLMKTAIHPTGLVHLSVKLRQDESERIRTVAKVDNRSVHFVMKEAIREYLGKKEAERRFIEAAKLSRAHYRTTGLHATEADISAWIEALETDISAPAPICHA